MIAFIRATYSKTDGRIQNHVSACRRLGCEYLVIDWPRTKVEQEAAITAKDRNTTSFTWVKSSYGNLRLSMVGRIGFLFYAFYQLLRMSKVPSRIVLADVDTAVLIPFLRPFISSEMVFDIYDHYSIVYKGRSRIIPFLENSISKKADTVVICAEWRRSHLVEGLRKLPIIIENMPICFDQNSYLGRHKIIHQKIRLIYIGVLQKEFRGLEDLYDAVCNTDADIELIIGGFGPLADLFSKSDCKKIKFIGQVAHKDVDKLSADADIIVALYYTKNAFHHKFAAPNKYYDHMRLGKAIITNDGTSISSIIKINNTGYIVDENSESISCLLKSIKRDEVAVKSQNAKTSWRYYQENNLMAYKTLFGAKE